MTQTAQSIRISLNRTVRYRYLLHLPPGYDPTQGRRWPLILYLHGRGERGGDLELLKTQGLTKKLETWADCPFIVVSPQCAIDNYWVTQVDALKKFLDAITAMYPVDRSRLYLTGKSMGGQGAWYLANAYPDLFAAVAPVSGPTNPLLADRIRQLPFWVFHNTTDPVVPCDESQRMVDLLKDEQADVRFTVYPASGHDAWTAAYDTPTLYEWMLSHKKRVMSDEE